MEKGNIPESRSENQGSEKVSALQNKTFAAQQWHDSLLVLHSHSLLHILTARVLEKRGRFLQLANLG